VCFKAWKDKPLHGQFIRGLVDGADLKMWTTCIKQYLIDVAIPGDSRVIDKIMLRETSEVFRFKN